MLAFSSLLKIFQLPYLSFPTSSNQVWCGARRAWGPLAAGGCLLLDLDTKVFFLYLCCCRCCCCCCCECWCCCQIFLVMLKILPDCTFLDKNRIVYCRRIQIEADHRSHHWYTFQRQWSEFIPIAHSVHEYRWYGWSATSLILCLWSGYTNLCE